jgi:hypothetical protein
MAVIDFYLRGYSGYVYPRILRRVFAKTRIHRAWLSGKLGVFIEVETRRRHGVCGYIN